MDESASRPVNWRTEVSMSLKTTNEKALELHRTLKGKIKVVSTLEVTSKETLSLVYSPGVAAPSLAIAHDPDQVSAYTWRQNTIAIISNGTAVLGLGNIGPKAALPVMEGKAMLFQQFAAINAVPLVIDAEDPDSLIEFCQRIAPSFGGINLEDIKAPECVYIEETLKRTLDIPVFHDDQHGTAIVVLAALINALRVVEKPLERVKVVVSGTGAAGSAIIRLLSEAGVNTLYGYNHQGVVDYRREKEYDEVLVSLKPYITAVDQEKTLADLLIDADVFIGVSKPDLVQAEDIAAMNDNAIVFALANPDPEITYDKAKAAGARIVGTGRSDFPNQINNVLAFPGLFKGALMANAAAITKPMILAASAALAGLVNDDLSEVMILPDIFDPRVVEAISTAVAEAAGMGEVNR